MHARIAWAAGLGLPVARAGSRHDALRYGRLRRRRGDTLEPSFVVGGAQSRKKWRRLAAGPRLARRRPIHGRHASPRRRHSLPLPRPHSSAPRLRCEAAAERPSANLWQEALWQSQKGAAGILGAAGSTRGFAACVRERPAGGRGRNPRGPGVESVGGSVGSEGRAGRGRTRRTRRPDREEVPVYAAAPPGRCCCHVTGGC